MSTLRVTVDRDNVNDEFVVVRKLHKRNGESVQAEELVLEIESSKTLSEVYAPESGLLRVHSSEGDEIAVGGLLFEITTESPETTDAADIVRPVTPPSEEAQLKASRTATELAQRLDVALRDIPSRGWITSADVLAAAKPAAARIHGDAAAIRDASTSVPAHGTVPKAPFRAVKTSLLKRKEARILAGANSSGSTSMIGTELSLGGSARLVPPPFLFQDSISDLVTFEAARLLKRYPDLNACYLDERTNGYFAEVNFGISFDAGHNLKVLALRNADQLSLIEVQAGFDRLLQLYESDAPIADELLHCSTVTLSDLSRSGATFMLPLLNASQSLIIGITRRDSDRFGLHASFDHRVSEGLQVARFLDELRGRLQSHYRPAPTNRPGALRCSVCDQTLEAEIETGVRGLLRIACADGSDGYLCRNCFEGW